MDWQLISLGNAVAVFLECIFLLGFIKKIYRLQTEGLLHRVKYETDEDISPFLMERLFKFIQKKPNMTLLWIFQN